MPRLDDTEPTALQIEMAKEEMLKQAYVYAREKNCSLLVALGMIQAETNRKMQQIRTLADGR